MLQRIMQWIFENKCLTFLGVLLFTFFVATIALAVESSNRLERLTNCEEELKNKTTTTTVSTTITEPTSTSDVTTVLPPTLKDYRLPSHVIPLQYQIRLEPDLSTGLTFDGTVSILIRVLTKTDKVLLHSDQLTIREIQIISDKGETSTTHYASSNDDREILSILPDKELEPGNHTLKISYSGSLDGIVGFYSSDVNEDIKIATSKFEPTYARQAFPCFDEPAMKAQFTVELVTPPNYIALSNMDQVNETVKEDGGKVVKFRESVRMSTYLVCFIICNFENKGDTIQTNGIGKDFPMKVYAAHDQIEKVQFSLDVGKKVTEYYIKYFDSAYPLPKLDMIAIPDFVSGAMEHWGLVTFKETNLLYDDDTTSTANQQNIARVVAHEVSHMWFGNLVTMMWWDELWLNEGFASYMQYKALEEVYPEWKMLDQFLTANSHSIYAFDGKLSSHPIVQKVESPDEITAIFDGITYNKGAAVIRMLEGFVSKEIFQKGVQAYMKKYELGNTITQDLLNEIDNLYKPPAELKLNLTKIMDTWTRQTGLPLVTVKKGSDNTIILTQKRFLADPDSKPPAEENFRWFIPITYTTDKGIVEKIAWLTDEPDATLTITLPADSTYIKLNNDQVGYYRVNYPADMWKSLEGALSTSSMTVSDKTHLLNDAFSLAQASEITFDVALDLTKYLVDENNYTPWAVASSEFSSLKKLLADSLAFVDLKTYVRSLTEKVYQAVAWNVGKNDTHDRKLLRSVILNMACSFGNEKCLLEASDLFKKWLDNEKTVIHPDLKNTVYYYGVQMSGEDDWIKTWDRYVKENDAQEKSKLMQALAASLNPSILKRYLQLAWDIKLVRSQDHLTVVQYISSNPVGTALVWDHFRENWPNFVKKFTINSRVLGNTVTAITNSFSSQFKLKEMDYFFDMYPDAGAGTMARKQAKENVKNNIRWLNTHEKAVAKWFTENKTFSS